MSGISFRHWPLLLAILVWGYLTGGHTPYERMDNLISMAYPRYELRSSGIIGRCWGGGGGGKQSNNPEQHRTLDNSISRLFFMLTLSYQVHTPSQNLREKITLALPYVNNFSIICGYFPITSNISILLRFLWDYNNRESGSQYLTDEILSWAVRSTSWKQLMGRNHIWEL